MELLEKHLSSIKIPTENDKVYKDECVYSFDNLDTASGIFVSLTSFIGLGKDHVEQHYNKTKEAVYLHIGRIKTKIPSPEPGDGPEKKITRLAIGVDGGFDPESGKKKFKYENVYKIVVLPEFSVIEWPNENLPEIVKLSVNHLLDLPSASKLAELESLSGTWDGEIRQVSKHAENLVQLNNGKKIPPTVLCGRRFFNGLGGNNHAVEHYHETQYPLAVKLGTITKDGKADVFSYSEDDMVEDPLLATHLQHWGINIAQMEKTEKSMIELEIEQNQKANEWSALCESDGHLKPIYGPGFTGMQNMGNSCYLNSIMQVIFRIPDFIHKYYYGCDAIFNQAPSNPAEDFTTQMAKLGYGLLSGKYSVAPPEDAPVDADPPGITPLMFKILVGKGHSEFSTKKQQDVQEFFLHLLTLLERYNKNASNPGECFKFEIEERYQCGQSKKVKYITKSETCLSLNIPMEAATNKEEVAAYELMKSQLEAEGKRVDPSVPIVRPKINFTSCLESFTQPEIINSFYSSAVNGNVTARKTTRLSTFPDYLVIQLKKFTLRDDWVPIKLDVSIEMPDELDISMLRGRGPQPEEEMLPEPEEAPPAPKFDQASLDALLEMGFPLESCKRALYQTGNSGVETAMAWIMEHISDPDFAAPFQPPGTESASSSEAVATIVSLGFTSAQAVKALRSTDNNVERAIDWIFSHPDDVDIPKFRDGPGKYRLVAFVSHMGTSTMVGHYVAHILKDGQWIIFNDSKVAISEHPPKDLGYLYFYERI
ncbi:hypothetical protein GWI33_017650 [Rhynchophorus ferrugineus]|uniref:Ubiquitin carboxyl-terminal hydrolase n=1 Tax=Rhynchophorus ferrugineus TaxID=354439 RepID=A0A834HXS7_RHYFE|nr:hypothetical protein GWI33_017650 [Rhynchophorus ferrugineus]